MRIVAIFFVIFNHTDLDGFSRYSVCEFGSIKYWIYLFISVLCKFAVPLYFMISGAVYLNREPIYVKTILLKITRMIAVLIVVSFMYYLRQVYYTKTFDSLDIQYFFSTLYESSIRSHLWFIYYYIAFLVSLPFLQAMVKKMKDEHFVWMIGIMLLFSVIQIVEFIVSAGQAKINSNIVPDWIVSGFVSWSCIGYYLEHRLEGHYVKNGGVLCGIISLILLSIECYLTYNFSSLGIISQKSQAFFSIFSFVLAMSIFLSVKFLCETKEDKKMSERITNGLIHVGSCCFGIYLLHMMPNRRFVIDPLVGIGMDAMIACLIWCFIDILICYIITAILKKVPGIKRYI